MKKVYIETPVGEIIDKLTILEIKKRKISKKEHLLQINKEYSSLKKTLKQNMLKIFQLVVLLKTKIIFCLK